MLETCRGHIIKYLLNKRTLHKFRLLGKYFNITKDGSGVYAFDKKPYGHCSSKTSKGGKTIWLQNVLEAKIDTE